MHWARSCLSLSGLMCLHDVACSPLVLCLLLCVFMMSVCVSLCLCVGALGGVGRGVVFVCGLMCLHDVSVVLHVSEHGRVWWGWKGLVSPAWGFCNHGWQGRFSVTNLTGFLFLNYLFGVRVLKGKVDSTNTWTSIRCVFLASTKNMTQARSGETHPKTRHQSTTIWLRLKM